MDQPVPMIEEFQELAQFARRMPAVTPAKDKVDVLERHFQQLLLLLGASKNGGAIRALSEQFNADMAPFREPKKGYTFQDAFSGRGYVAEWLRQEDNLQSAIQHFQGDPEEVEAMVRGCAAALEEFNYHPYEDEGEFMYLDAFLRDLHASRDAIPQGFASFDGQGGLPAAFVGANWSQTLESVESGYYEDRSRPSNPDGSVQWLLILRKLVLVEGKFPFPMVFVMHQHEPAQLFFKHPQEYAWFPWDGKSLFPGMLQGLCEAYAWVCTLSRVREKDNDWFQQGLDYVLRINRKYMWQHDVLKGTLSFNHEPDGQYRQFGEFMHGHNTCCLTIKSDAVWMNIYANKIGGNWEQEVRFVVPPQPQVLLIHPIEERKLTRVQKMVLLQRANRALVLKTATIEYEQKNKLVSTS